MTDIAAVLLTAIDEERRRQHLSLYRLARRAGLGYQTVWRTVRTREHEPTLRVLARLAGALGLIIEMRRVDE